MRSLVRYLNGLRNAVRREPISGKATFIERYLHFTPAPTDQRGFRDVIDLLDRGLDTARELAQRRRVVTGAVQRQGQDRHIVDRSRLDDRESGAGRDDIVVRLKLFAQPDKGSLLVLPHKEADDGDRLTRARGCVDVLYAGDLPQQLL